MGLFITELSYQQGGWDKARGIIIIKQAEEIRPEARGRKLRTLFDHLPGYDEKAYRYKYQTMVRNQTLPAIEVWEQNKRRADAENRIKELKKDIGIQGFCMNTFGQRKLL